MSDAAFGTWAGLAVDNTAEAIAAGALYSDVAGMTAGGAKTARNAMIGFVVLGYAIHFARQGLAQEIEHKAAFLWEKFPKFVLGFLIVSALASIDAFERSQLVSLANLSRWSFLLTFAGVGLMINFRELLNQGIRPFVCGFVGELFIAAVTLGLVIVADKIVGL